MKASTWTASLVASFVMVSSGSASATTLATPLLSDSPGFCVVTNLGTKPLTAAVRMIDVAGQTMTPTTDTCNGQSIGPLASCVTFVDPVMPGTPLTGYFCLVTAKGKFRAAALATGQVTIPVAATK